MSKHFSDEELGCRCGCGVFGMTPDFIEKLEELRLAYNKPMIVSSGYRCPEYNDKISTTGRLGPHTTGRAIDILASGVDVYELLYFAIGYEFAGIGVKQSGPHYQRFIHLDMLDNAPGCPRPTVWSY